MLRLVAILLISTLATLIFADALRSGRVQASFAESNLKDRRDDPPSFWFFTLAWGLISILGVAGSAALMYYAMNDSGPFASGGFFAFHSREWPLVILSLACTYLLFSKVFGGASKSSGS